MGEKERLQCIADELDIRGLLAEYCLRLEVNEFSEWVELFTEDCVYKVYGRTLNGHDELAAMLSQAPHGLHMAGAPRIRIDGDSAATVQNFIFVNGATRESTMGWYFNTLRRTPEGWRIHTLDLKFYK